MFVGSAMFVGSKPPRTLPPALSTRSETFIRIRAGGSSEPRHEVSFTDTITPAADT